MFQLSFNNGITTLLDAKINNIVSVVGQNNINKIFSNVVDITLNGRDQKLTLAGLFSLNCFHMWLKMSHCRLHGFCALKNKRKLHLAATK